MRRRLPTLTLLRKNELPTSRLRHILDQPVMRSPNIALRHQTRMIDAAQKSMISIMRKSNRLHRLISNWIRFHQRLDRPRILRKHWERSEGAQAPSCMPPDAPPSILPDRSGDRHVLVELLQCGRLLGRQSPTPGVLRNPFRIALGNIGHALIRQIGPIVLARLGKSRSSSVCVDREASENWRESPINAACCS